MASAVTSPRRLALRAPSWIARATSLCRCSLALNQAVLRDCAQPAVLMTSWIAGSCRYAVMVELFVALAAQQVPVMSAGAAVRRGAPHENQQLFISKVFKIVSAPSVMASVALSTAAVRSHQLWTVGGCAVVTSSRMTSSPLVRPKLRSTARRTRALRRSWASRAWRALLVPINLSGLDSRVSIFRSSSTIIGTAVHTFVSPFLIYTRLRGRSEPGGESWIVVPCVDALGRDPPPAPDAVSRRQSTPLPVRLV